MDPQKYESPRAVARQGPEVISFSLAPVSWEGRKEGKVCLEK